MRRHAGIYVAQHWFAAEPLASSSVLIQICYCVLTPSKLYCFEDHSRSALTSCINLAALACLCSRQDCQLELRLEEYDAPVLLRAFSLAEAAGWLSAVSSII